MKVAPVGTQIFPSLVHFCGFTSPVSWRLCQPMAAIPQVLVLHSFPGFLLSPLAACGFWGPLHYFKCLLQIASFAFYIGCRVSSGEGLGELLPVDLLIQISVECSLLHTYGLWLRAQNTWVNFRIQLLQGVCIFREEKGVHLKILKLSTFTFQLSF